MIPRERVLAAFNRKPTDRTPLDLWLIDILNPIQHICPGMERDALQREFGPQLLFHGGVDNQRALSFGTVEDVKKETRTCLKTLGREGGYVCRSCHNVQAGTRVENILAMIETVHES